MKKALILLSVIAFSLTSCSKKEDEAQKAADQMQKSMEQMGQAMGQMQNGTAGQATHASGVAIPAKTLVTYLPASVSGYGKEGDAEYMDMDMQGTKYSHASQSYTNGEKRLKVSIFDFNFIAGLSMAYGMLLNMNMETNTEITRSEKFNGFPGWFQWNKQSSDGSIGVVVGDRVFVVIEADNGVTDEELHAAANSLDYSGIAGQIK